MLDLDQWQEIFSAIRKNKLRTFLTSFSVAWGIFILVILLGSGNGLSKGVMHNFSDASNSVWMWGGTTSKAFSGFNAGRKVQLTNEDVDLVRRSNDNLDNVSARCNIWGNVISYKNKYADFQMQAIHPGHQVTENLQLMSGRLLNNFDVKEFRKVAIIGRAAKEQLFRDEDPVGKYIQIRGIPFLVVGVFDDIHEDETKRLYIPISLAQKTFITKNQVGTITFTVGNASIDQSNSYIDQIKSLVAGKHSFAKDDDRAMGSFNALREYRQMQSMFRGIKLFVGVIGIFTIIAGIVGVGNIMLIVVKERTKEIGIRKAIGARPGSIIWMILQESLLITSIAGYVGLFAGIALLETIAKLMPAGDFFRDPGVNFNVAVGAVLMMILAGLVAGFIPARRAARIRPIEALHDE